MVNNAILRYITRSTHIRTYITMESRLIYSKNTRLPPYADES